MNECYGIPAEVIARLCRVNVATARRWKRGATRIPEAAKMILTGDLGAFDPAFRGWKMRDGKLISPEGWEATVGEILSLPLLRAQISAYQAKERLTRGMEEQPMPADLPDVLASLNAGG
jgi:hypothetical protein